MNVLVTGASGFLGGHVVKDLRARGHTVTALGRDQARLERLGPPIITADIRDAAALRRACAGIEAVVHAAALSAPWGQAAAFYSVNVTGTQNLIQACLEQRVRRLVHISSPAVVFADRDQFDLPDHAPYPERFSSLYAATKKQAEQLVLAAPLERVVLRPKAIYGPGDTALLPRLLAAARAGRLVQIGDGQNRVQLSFVGDVVRGVHLALECPVRQPVLPYTITGPEAVLLWQAIRQVLEGAGLSSRLPRLSLAQALSIARGMEWLAGITNREPRLTRYTVQLLARTQTYDISRARADLGYVPRVSLEEGLASTLPALRGEV